VDSYEILGVPQNATQEEIRAAFKKRVFSCHPDLHSGNPDAEALFKEISGAYSRLKTSNARAEYDLLAAQSCAQKSPPKFPKVSLFLFGVWSAWFFWDPAFFPSRLPLKVSENTFLQLSPLKWILLWGNKDFLSNMFFAHKILGVVEILGGILFFVTLFRYLSWSWRFFVWGLRECLVSGPEKKTTKRTTPPAKSFSTKEGTETLSMEEPSPQEGTPESLFFRVRNAGRH